MCVEQTLSNGITIKPSKARDMLQIAENIREDDRLEILAHAERSPIEAITISCKASKGHCWTVFHEETPAFIFGVAPLMDGIGSPWLLGTPLMDKFQTTFVRNSKPILEKLYEIYPTLYNTVWEHNALHIRWLKWLGFKFNEEPIDGFYQFTGGKHV